MCFITDRREISAAAGIQAGLSAKYAIKNAAGDWKKNPDYKTFKEGYRALVRVSERLEAYYKKHSILGRIVKWFDKHTILGSFGKKSKIDALIQELAVFQLLVGGKNKAKELKGAFQAVEDAHKVAKAAAAGAHGRKRDAEEVKQAIRFGEVLFGKVAPRVADEEEVEDDELAQAIKASLEEAAKQAPKAKKVPRAAAEEVEDDEMAQAIKASLDEAARRAAHVEEAHEAEEVPQADEGEVEDDELAQAIRASLEDAAKQAAEVEEAPEAEEALRADEEEVEDVEMAQAIKASLEDAAKNAEKAEKKEDKDLLAGIAASKFEAELRRLRAVGIDDDLAVKLAEQLSKLEY